MYTASERRFKKRVPCRLQVPDGSHSGMVLNVSRGGLFVQTSAGAAPGDAVHLDLAMEGSEPVPVDARVVWRRVVASHLRTVSTGGMGVAIQYASDAYFGFVACLAAGAAAGEPDPAPPTARSGYRVRLRLAGSPRTRIVIVDGADETEARQQARAVVGLQWSVLDLDEIAREN